MAKIKLTKNEYKKQKDSLKMFTRYLPTLLLKKQQLQMEIRKVEARDQEVRERKEALNNDFRSWIAVFGDEESFDASLVEVEYIRTRQGNIAGVEIPVFEGAAFRVAEYDLFVKPLWVDKAAEKLKTIMLLDLESRVLREQVRLLGLELRTTTQRVNLFEKVKIPETRSHIKKIAVYLGDQQTAAVVRGKISKKKIEAS